MFVSAGIILIRNYFVTIPDSLEESARIYGANDFIVFLRICLPTSVPILAAIILNTLPILTVYPFIQKYFVHGITLGSIKE